MRVPGVRSCEVGLSKVHCQFANSGKPELASRNDAVKGSSIRRCRGIECGRVQAGDVVS